MNLFRHLLDLLTKPRIQLSVLDELQLALYLFVPAVVVLAAVMFWPRRKRGGR